jgi:hypothetical protein
VVVVGLVVAAIVLANRKPSASPSPSPSDTPSPTPTPTPTPTVTAHPTPTPVPSNTPTQQAQLLFPTSGSECGSNGTYNGCPVTTDLASAAGRWRSTHAAAQEPLCRCASTYSSPFAQQNDTLRLTGDQNNPDRAAVQVSLTLPSGTETMVVLLSLQGGGWIATDTYCDDPQNRLTSGTPITCTH